MRALIVVHDPGSIPSLVGERLEHHGYSLEMLPIATSVGEPAATVTFPDPADYDLIAPMGAVWSVYDHDTIGTWINDELDFLRAADAAAVPTLGVCFGGQAMAQALGGKVIKSEAPQVGWHHLESTLPDELPTGPWMQWHYDRFEAPPGAEIIAKDDVGTQAFRLRRNLGLQFHPEVTTEHVTAWLDMEHADGEGELAKLGITRADLLAACEANVPLAKPNTNKLVDWFIREIAMAPVA